MSDPDIVPHIPYGATVAPAAPDGGAGFLALSARITSLTTAAIRLKEGAWALQKHMERNADKARQLSEMCTTAEVDAEFTEQILEVAAALQRVADASGQLSATADTMAGHANGFNQAHENEYRGIFEAVQASSHRQAKPGFYRPR